MLVYPLTADVPEVVFIRIYSVIKWPKVEEQTSIIEIPTYFERRQNFKF